MSTCGHKKTRQCEEHIHSYEVSTYATTAAVLHVIFLPVCLHAYPRRTYAHVPWSFVWGPYTYEYYLPGYLCLDKEYLSIHNFVWGGYTSTACVLTQLICLAAHPSPFFVQTELPTKSCHKRLSGAHQQESIRLSVKLHSTPKTQRFDVYR